MPRQAHHERIADGRITALSRARLAAILTPVLLLGGALVSQYGFGLVPCEMCLWQRWPHLAAIALALAAIALRARPPASRALTGLAAAAILVSGAIGVFHAGVEWHWWRGLSRCATPPAAGSTHDMMAAIMAAPLVRCDQAQWRLWGISLAGWNALLSLGFGSLTLWLTAKRP